MNDADVTRLLRSLDEERELSPADAATVRAAMLAELDRALGTPTGSVRSLDEGRSRRWPVLLSAAAVVLVLVAGLAVLAQPGDAPTTTDVVSATTDDVPTVGASGPETILEACVRFQLATRVDGEDWYVVLTADDGATAPSDYDDVLADAWEELAASPEAVDISDEGGLARAIRAGDDEVVDLLLAVERNAVERHGVRCLR